MKVEARREEGGREGGRGKEGRREEGGRKGRKDERWGGWRRGGRRREGRKDEGRGGRKQIGSVEWRVRERGVMWGGVTESESEGGRG